MIVDNSIINKQVAIKIEKNLNDSKKNIKIFVNDNIYKSIIALRNNIKLTMNSILRLYYCKDTEILNYFKLLYKNNMFECEITKLLLRNYTQCINIIKQNIATLQNMIYNNIINLIENINSKNIIYNKKIKDYNIYYNLKNTLNDRVIENNNSSNEELLIKICSIDMYQNYLNKFIKHINIMLSKIDNSYKIFLTEDITILKHESKIEKKFLIFIENIEEIAKYINNSKLNNII